MILPLSGRKAASLIILQKLTKHLCCSISIHRSWRRGAEGDGAHFRRGFIIEDLVGLLCDEDVIFLSDMPIHVDVSISFPAKTARKKLTQGIQASCLRIIACSRCLNPPSSVYTSLAPSTWQSPAYTARERSHWALERVSRRLWR